MTKHILEEIKGLGGVDDLRVVDKGMSPPWQEPNAWFPQVKQPPEKRREEKQKKDDPPELQPRPKEVNPNNFKP